MKVRNAPPGFTAPHGFESWNPAMRGAYVKGYRAALDRNPVCPYVDHRKDSGRLTWSRAFIRAWGDGYSAGMDARA